MFITFKRILDAGWKNFYYDGWISLATTFILVLAIFLVSGIFLFKDVSQFLVTSLQEKTDISVYFKDFVPESDILKLKLKLSQLPEVKKVAYISKEEAIEKLVKRHPQLAGSVEETKDLLRLSSLNISVFRESQYEEVVNFLKGSNFKEDIDKIDYYERKPVIEKIFSFTSFFDKSAIVISILSVVIAILIAFNTIRLAILNQSEEIKIQKLVGASNWFIRGPFLVQGAISGLFAIAIAALVLGFLCWFLSPRIEYFFSGLDLYGLFWKDFLALLLIQFLTGILLSVASSAIAVRKYLKI